FCDAVQNHTDDFVLQSRVGQQIKVVRHASSHKCEYPFFSAGIDEQWSEPNNFAITANLYGSNMGWRENFEPRQYPFRALKRCRARAALAELQPFIFDCS